MAQTPQRKQEYREEHREEMCAYARQYYKEHLDEVKTAKLRRKFGITLEEYKQRLETQNGVCIICGENRGNQRLGVDHDHNTGEVCGLLCRKCNIGLGFFADNPVWLHRAANYREKLLGG